MCLLAELKSLNDVRNDLGSMTRRGSMHLGRTHLPATVLGRDLSVHVYAFTSGLFAAVLHNAFYRQPSFNGTGRDVLMVILDVLNVCIGSEISNVSPHRQSRGVVGHFIIDVPSKPGDRCPARVNTAGRPKAVHYQHRPRP